MGSHSECNSHPRLMLTQAHCVWAGFPAEKQPKRMRNTTHAILLIQSQRLTKPSELAPPKPQDSSCTAQESFFQNQWMGLAPLPAQFWRERECSLRAGMPSASSSTEMCYWHLQRQANDVVCVLLTSILTSPTIQWLISNLLPTNMQMNDKQKPSASAIILLIYKPLSSVCRFFCVYAFMHQGFHYFQKHTPYTFML